MTRRSRLGRRSRSKGESWLHKKGLLKALKKKIQHLARSDATNDLARSDASNDLARSDATNDPDLARSDAKKDPTKDPNARGVEHGATNDPNAREGPDKGKRAKDKDKDTDKGICTDGATYKVKEGPDGKRYLVGRKEL